LILQGECRKNLQVSRVAKRECRLIEGSWREAGKCSIKSTIPTKGYARMQLSDTFQIGGTVQGVTEIGFPK